MSEPFLSGSGTILSLHRGNDLLLGSREANTHRVRGRVEYDGDLAGLEVLPCPEPNQLTIRLVEFVQRSFELGVVELGSGRARAEGLARSTIGHPSDEPSSALGTPAMIGEAALGDAVRPGNRIIQRDVIEATPDHEQRVVQDFRHIGRLRSSPQVPLQRLVHHSNHDFEPVPTFEISLHHTPFAERQTLASDSTPPTGTWFPSITSQHAAHRELAIATTTDLDRSIPGQRRRGERGDFRPCHRLAGEHMMIA